MNCNNANLIDVLNLNIDGFYNLNPRKGRDIFFFLLLWGVFEKKASFLVHGNFNCTCTLDTISKLISNSNPTTVDKKTKQFDIDPLNKSYIYFRRRYITVGHQVVSSGYFATAKSLLNQLGGQLEPKSKIPAKYGWRSCDTKYKNKIISILSNARANTIEIIESTLYIANRVRNNLCHGTKSINGFDHQHDNFSHLNQSLAIAIKVLF